MAKAVLMTVALEQCQVVSYRKKVLWSLPTPGPYVLGAEAGCNCWQNHRGVQASCAALSWGAQKTLQEQINL